MALHQIDKDTVLNDVEYEKHVDSNWFFWLFIVGAALGGFGVHFALDYFQFNNLPKWIKFTLIILTGIFSGYLLAKIRNIIQLILLYVLIVGGLFLIGYFLWSIL
ncbi:MAG: hypothetical protein ABIJ15_00710 [bacterium]